MKAIEEIERALREVASVWRLHEIIKNGLGTLRHRYRRTPSLFADQEIARLRELGHICDRLGSVLDLMERATYVHDPAEYESVQSVLRDHAAKLGTLPVGEMILEELRTLPVRPPAIQSEEKQRQQAQEARVLMSLEASAERCPEGHAMKLRRGRRGAFWGCGEYPTCRATRNLSSNELALWRTIE